MDGVPRLSTVDLLIKKLKQSRKELVKMAKDLPDEDAFAMPYSVLIDGINHIDELINEIKPALKDAKAERKLAKHCAPNRARKWCMINDSRRKPNSSQS